jgi:ubiquinone/menaquinone biosynthesis C-methylase UbiE
MMPRTVAIPLAALAVVTTVCAQEPPLPPDSLQRPGVLLHEIKLDAGMTVADIGTGLGNMLAMLSRRAGPTGRVLAEDTEDQLLAAAKETAVTQNLTNITFIKGTDTDPKLPEGQVDVAFAFDVYHHFPNPEKMLAAIYKSLRPDGRLIIVEYYKRESAMPDGKALTRIRLDLPDMIKELEANHFHLVEEKEYLKNSQYLLILEKS